MTVPSVASPLTCAWKVRLTTVDGLTLTDQVMPSPMIRVPLALPGT